VDVVLVCVTVTFATVTVTVLLMVMVGTVRVTVTVTLPESPELYGMVWLPTEEATAELLTVILTNAVMLV
jgi:hypothetical protein